MVDQEFPDLAPDDLFGLALDLFNGLSAADRMVIEALDGNNPEPIQQYLAQGGDESIFNAQQQKVVARVKKGLPPRGPGRPPKIQTKKFHNAVRQAVFWYHFNEDYALDIDGGKDGHRDGKRPSAFLAVGKCASISDLTVANIWNSWPETERTEAQQRAQWLWIYSHDHRNDE